jgi:hypothetical protein
MKESLRLVLALVCAGTLTTTTAIAQTGGVPREDLCALLTEAEAEAIVGKPLDPPRQQPGGDCRYGTAGSNVPDVTLSILPKPMASRSEFDKFIADQVNQINTRMRKALPDYPEMKADEVKDLGQPAYYWNLGLVVLKGSRMLGIYTDREKAIAIARKALPRLK